MPRLARLAVLLTVAGGSVGVIAPAATAATPTVVISADGVAPRELTVAPGTTVEWHNADSRRHRIRTTSGPVELDSGNLEPGDRWSARLDQQGTYTYVDHRDEADARYHGSVTVAGGGDAPPTTTASDPGGGAPPSAGAPPAPEAPATAAVDIADRSFSPADVRIRPGGTVTWTNRSDRRHTVTDEAGNFASPILGGGQSFQHSFAAAGTYRYYCELHPEMVATVTVDGGAGAPGSGATATTAPTTAAPPPASPTGRAPVAGAPGSTAAAGAARQPVTHTVDIVDFGFEPDRLEVIAGDAVTFRNTGVVPHTATASGVFDTGLVRKGGTATTTLAEPATVAYVCELHPQMTGTIVVLPAPDPAAGGGTALGTSAPGSEPPGAEGRALARRAGGGSTVLGTSPAGRSIDGTTLGVLAAAGILGAGAALLAGARRMWEAGGR